MIIPVTDNYDKESLTTLSSLQERQFWHVEFSFWQQLFNACLFYQRFQSFSFLLFYSSFDSPSIAIFFTYFFRISDFENPIFSTSKLKKNTLKLPHQNYETSYFTPTKSLDVLSSIPFLFPTCVCACLSPIQLALLDIIY